MVEYTISIITNSPFIFAYIFKGQSFYAVKKTKKFIISLKSDLQMISALNKAVKISKYLAEED